MKKTEHNERFWNGPDIYFFRRADATQQKNAPRSVQFSTTQFNTVQNYKTSVPGLTHHWKLSYIHSLNLPSLPIIPEFNSSSTPDNKRKQRWLIASSTSSIWMIWTPHRGQTHPPSAKPSCSTTKRTALIMCRLWFIMSALTTSWAHSGRVASQCGPTFPSVSSPTSPPVGTTTVSPGLAT